MTFETSCLQLFTLNSTSPTRSSCIDYALWDATPTLVDWYDKGGFSFDLCCVTDVPAEDQTKGYTQDTLRSIFLQFGMPSKVQQIALNGWRSPLGEFSHLYWGMVDGFRLARMKKEWMVEEYQHYYDQGDGEWFVTSCLCAGIELEYAIALRAALIRHLRLADLSPTEVFDHSSSQPFFKCWHWPTIRQLTFDIVAGRVAAPICQLGPWITLHERLRLPLSTGLHTLRTQRHTRTALVKPDKTQKTAVEKFFATHEFSYQNFSTQTLLGFGFNGLLRDVIGPLPGATTFSDTALTINVTSHQGKHPITLIGRRAAEGNEATACWGTIQEFKCLRIEKDWLLPKQEMLYYLSDGEWFMVQCLAVGIPFIAAFYLRAAVIELMHQLLPALARCPLEDLEFGSNTVATLWKKHWNPVIVKQRALELMNRGSTKISLGRWVMQPEIPLPLGLQQFDLINSLENSETTHQRAQTEPAYGQDRFSQEAFRSFSRSTSNDPEVRYAMALAYMYGQGVAPDLEKALSWLDGAQRPPFVLQAIVLRNKIEALKKKPLRLAAQTKVRLLGEQLAAPMRTHGLRVKVEENGFLHVHYDVETSPTIIEQLRLAMGTLKSRHPDKEYELCFSYQNWTQLEYKVLSEADVTAFIETFTTIKPEPVEKVEAIPSLEKIFTHCKITVTNNTPTPENFQQAFRKLAAAGSAEDLAYLLKEYGSQFDINAKDTGNTHQKTALHWAVVRAQEFPTEKAKYCRCIELFMEHGAKSDIADIAGKTACDYAADDVELLTLLQLNTNKLSSLLPSKRPSSPVQPLPNLTRHEPTIVQAPNHTMESSPSTPSASTTTKKKKHRNRKPKVMDTHTKVPEPAVSAELEKQKASSETDSSEGDAALVFPKSEPKGTRKKKQGRSVVKIPAAATAPAELEPHFSKKKRTTLPASELLSAQLLRWSIDSLSTMPSADTLLALPTRNQSLNSYYAQFIPLLLEETRAKLSESIERVRTYDKRDTQTYADVFEDEEELNLSVFEAFDLKLQKNTQSPSHDAVVILPFDGNIPNTITHGRTLNVVLLVLENGQNRTEVLGIASEKSAVLHIEIYLTRSLYTEFTDCFRQGSCWTTRFLGSIALEQRMHEACLQAIAGPCIERIARSELNPLPNIQQRLYPKLNEKQDHFVQGFLSLKKGEMAILQGGPGTGKSTTLSTIIVDLHARQENIMVCTHSNRGIRVLAHKVSQTLPKTPMLLITAQTQIPATLQPLSLYTWYNWVKTGLQNAQVHANHYAGYKTETPVTHKGPALPAYLRTTLQTLYEALKLFNLLTQAPLDQANFTALFTLLDNLNHADHNKSKLKQSIDALVNAWSRKKQENIEHHLLHHCKLVFVTLSGAGQKSLENLWQPDTLIIDEAERAVEAETLIALQHNPDKVLLAGDPKQLAPRSNVKAFSRVYANWLEGKTYGYRRSMLWRLVKDCQQTSTTLTVQYRMHPEIYRWPAHFYYQDVALHTDPSLLARQPLAKISLLMRPYALYTISGRSKTDRYTHSTFNPLEADYIVKIVDHILTETPLAQIGIVSPYAAQKTLIIKKLGTRISNGTIEVDTVDNFQGEEKDIILFSITTTKVSEFLKEPGRLIVALTSAKHCLIILGNLNSLHTHDLGQLIQDATQRGLRYDQYALDDALRFPNRIITTAVNPLYESYYRQAEHSHLSNEERFRYYKISAEGDYAPAQYALAKYYWPGPRLLSTIDVNIVLAEAWLERAAAQQHIASVLWLAQAYEKGDVLSRDHEKGLYWYREAAKSGSLEAYYQLGRYFQTVKKNLSEAKKHYLQAAQYGHSEAAYQLAQMLPENEAWIWYQNAADQGYVLACRYCAKISFDTKNYAKAKQYLEIISERTAIENYQLAFSLQKIKNQDLVRIFNLYQAASTTNLMEVHYELAQLYVNGKGCPQNFNKAHQHYANAAAQGHILAMYYLAEMLMSGPTSLRDNKTAFEWFTKAALHLPEAEYQRCQMLLTGNGVQSNAKAGYTGLKRLADQHAHVLAQYQLFLLLREGKGCDANLDEALRYGRLAADNNHLEAQYQIAKIYAERTDAAANQLAAIYFKKAANQEHPDACFHYALLLKSQGQQRHSIEYLKRATAKQHRAASYALLEHYLLSEDANLTAAYSLCETLCQQQLSNALTHYTLARLLDTGIPCKQDINRAMEHYNKAWGAGETHAAFFLAQMKESQGLFLEAREYYARAPQREAKFHLACLFANGKGGLTEIPLAIQHFNEFLQALPERNSIFVRLKSLVGLQQPRVSDLDSEAHYRLGCLYKVNNLSSNALSEFTLAANVNHKDALYELGVLYEAGIGTVRDETRARSYYQRARELGHTGASYKLTRFYSLQRFFTSHETSPTVTNSSQEKENTSCRIM